LVIGETPRVGVKPREIDAPVTDWDRQPEFILAVALTFQRQKVEPFTQGELEDRPAERGEWRGLVVSPVERSGDPTHFCIGQVVLQCCPIYAPGGRIGFRPIAGTVFSFPSDRNRNITSYT